MEKVIMYSVDGKAWEIIDVQLVNVKSITYAKKFVCVGSYIYISKNLTDWETVKEGTSTYNAICASAEGGYDNSK